MMDLTTTYLGLELPHPLITGSSPLTTDVDSLKRFADAGAAAVVMHSLFEEQIERCDRDFTGEGGFEAAPAPEALSYFPQRGAYAHEPDEYLEKIRAIKKAVDVPVIGSLNGAATGDWMRYARLIEEAGADALELAIYYVPTDPGEACDTVEHTTVELGRQLTEQVSIPVAVKISPFYSSLPHLARELVDAGVDGLVVFNRFFHPDINAETLEVERRLVLSQPSDLFLRLRWLAILSACDRRCDLAISGGVHSGLDAIKAVMCGACAVQVVSAVLKHGPAHLTAMLEAIRQWMEAHGYESLRQMMGSMNLKHCPEASAYERANYVHILQRWDADRRTVPAR